MNNNSIKKSIVINASPEKIWEVLTDPTKIVIYTGINTRTDWAKGSDITWEGEMNGMPVRNKGAVLENIPNKHLEFTYWSGLGGDEDLPENYSEITYKLNPEANNSVELTYSRIKIPTELEKNIFETHLPTMLEEMKKLAEE